MLQTSGGFPSDRIVLTVILIFPRLQYSISNFGYQWCIASQIKLFPYGRSVNKSPRHHAQPSSAQRGQCADSAGREPCEPSLVRGT